MRKKTTGLIIIDLAARTEMKQPRRKAEHEKLLEAVLSGALDSGESIPMIRRLNKKC